MKKRHLPSPLLAILDLATLGEGLVRAALAARSGGATWFLLRAKGAPDEVREKLALELLAALEGATLSLHGDPEMAKRLGLGLHLPSAELGRPVGDSPSPVGGSCHCAKELRQAAAAGYDYCFLSPVFAPLSKEGAAPPLGVEGFGQLAGGAGLPVYALGGITPESVPALAAAGASGVAAIGGIFLAPDVEAAARRWVEATQTAFGR